MTRTDAAGPDPPGRAERPLGRRIADTLVLAAHRLTIRCGLLPPEFGRDVPVDANDPAALRAEWARYFRLWRSRQPEEIFALQLAAALLAAVGLALGLAIAVVF